MTTYDRELDEEKLAGEIRRRIIENSPEASEIRAHMERFAEDGRRLLALRPELFAKWPEQYVAISGGRLFHNSDFEALLQELRNNGIDPAHTVVRYLTDRLVPHICLTRV